MERCIDKQRYAPVQNTIQWSSDWHIKTYRGRPMIWSGTMAPQSSYMLPPIAKQGEENDTKDSFFFFAYTSTLFDSSMYT